MNATRTTVATAIGDLHLENGYPTAATAAALYDAMDLHRATQAYIWALPAVGFKALYDAQAKTLGTKNGDVLLYHDLADKAGMLTPNITTLYAFSFWDLAAQGPLVVEVPAGLIAGGVLDIWQQPLSDMGQTGPDKGQGGKYLIMPPGHPTIDAPDEAALLAKGEELAAAEQARTDAIYENAQAAQAEEAALLPEKFRGKSAVEIARAYAELEKKLGQREEPQEPQESDEAPEATDTPEEVEEAQEEPTATAELLRAASEEFAKDKEMSAETMEKLSALPSADLVKAYAEIQKAAAPTATITDAEALEVVTKVGGKDVYDKALAWAGETFSQAEADDYDAVIATGNKAAIAFAVEALTTRYKATVGFEGDTISGGRSRGPQVAPFRSNAELATAIGDPRYHRDPAYRMDVEARLAVSGDLL